MINLLVAISVLQVVTSVVLLLRVRRVTRILYMLSPPSKVELEPSITCGNPQPWRPELPGTHMTASAGRVPPPHMGTAPPLLCQACGGSDRVRRHYRGLNHAPLVLCVNCIARQGADPNAFK